MVLCVYIYININIQALTRFIVTGPQMIPCKDVIRN